MNKFQESLNELLQDNNISRLKLANIIGVNSTTINGYFNDNFYPHIDIAIKMANYFKCSLDYLFGLSYEKINNNSNKNSFIENFNNLLKEHKVSIARAMREMNMGETNYYRWKKGLIPKTSNLIIIVQYFDTSLDYLIGNKKD